jgi:fermentation-respiration switch protein FrsA (DUF1100 family)
MIPTLVALLVIVALGALFFRLVEPSLVYYPIKATEEFFQPDIKGETVEDAFFHTEDGLRLHGWWVSAKGERPTLLICHGNAGNISHRLDWMELLVAQGFGVFIFDYRGYGKSQGKPVEEGLYRDVTAAYRYAVGERRVPPERLFVLGQSLGGAVALDLAVREPCARLILESSFTSVRDMARLMFGPLPVHWVTHSRFDNLSKVKLLKVPVLFIHGRRDEIVPFKQGERLYEAAPPPKSCYWVSDAGHNDVYLVGGQEYLSRIESFVAHSP